MEQVKFTVAIRHLIPISLCLGAVAATWPLWLQMAGQAFAEQHFGLAAIAIPLGLWMLVRGFREASTSPVGNQLSLACGMLGALLLWTCIPGGPVVLQNVGAVLLVWSAPTVMLPKREVLRSLPSLLILCFAVEIPGTLSALVTLPIARLNAQIVGFTLGCTGANVEVLGAVVRSSSFPDGLELEIVGACDGLRLLWVVLLFSVFFSYLYHLRRWSVVLLMFAAPLVTMGANLVRILGNATVYSVANKAVGDAAHDVGGVLLMGIACLIPYHIANRSRVIPWRRAPQRQAVVESVSPRARRWILFLNVSMVIMLAVTGFTIRYSESERSSNSLIASSIMQRLDGLPYRLEDYVACSEALPKSQLLVLRPDAHLSRRYASLRSDGEFRLVVAFHRDGRVHQGHGPEVCYASGGWTSICKQSNQVTYRQLEGEHRVVSLRRVSKGVPEDLVVHQLQLTPRPDSKASLSCELLRLLFVFDLNIPTDEQEQLINGIQEQLLNAPG